MRESISPVLRWWQCIQLNPTVLLQRNQMASHSGLVYTTTFKLFNVVTASRHIGLSEDAWIETRSEFKGEPSQFSPHLLVFDTSPLGSGLRRFFQQLLDSEVMIGSRHTEEEAENNPFDVHDCSYIALAISILTDCRFVAVLRLFATTRPQFSPVWVPGPHCFWETRMDTPR